MNKSKDLAPRQSRFVIAMAVIASLFMLVNQVGQAALAQATTDPTITIAAPTQGATFASPATITVTANASGGGRDIEDVKFYVNDALRSEDATAPYSWAWNNVSAGIYTLSAVVTTDNGLMTRSASVEITVTGDNMPPQVKLTSPLRGMIFAAPGVINLTATAKDADGSVSKVEFYNGPTKLGEDTTAPYQFTWRDVPAKSAYNVVAKAVDDSGLIGSSAPAQIAVVASMSSIKVKDTNYPIPADRSKVHFVSTKGNDTSGKGTEDAPWATLTKAVNAAPEGGTVVMRAGVYRTEPVNFRKKLTIQPYPHEQVWLKGSLVVDDWAKAGNVWRKDGWNFEFPPISVGGAGVNACPDCIDPNWPEADFRDMVFVDGLPQKQVLSQAEVAPGTFYVDMAADQIFLGTDPTGKTVEVTAHQRGIGLMKTDPKPASEGGQVIRGLGFMHFANQGLYVEIPFVTLENNTFVWNAVEGVGLNGNARGKDPIVRGNTFSFNGRKGMGGSRVDRMVMEDNVFSYNNLEMFRRAWDAAGVKLIKSDDMLIRNNLVEENLAHALWLDVSVTDATVVGNTVRNNQVFGIFFEVSSRALIAGNVSVGNSAGIAISGSSAARIYNNTLVDNGRPILVKDTNRINNAEQNGGNQEAIDAEIKAGIDWETRDVEIKNNIFSNATITSAPKAMIETYHGACGDVPAPCNDKEPMISVMDHNAYYRTDPAQPTNIASWYPFVGLNKSYTTFETFRKETNFEQHGKIVDGETTNPFFANSAYRLKKDSIARELGAPLPADVATALGLAPGATVDAGAFQYSENAQGAHRVALPLVVR